MARAKTFSTPKDPPRKQVLMLSCMDLRLIDNITTFMNAGNLQNRYDQLIYAGAAMGVRLLSTNHCETGYSLPWKSVFFDHLAVAINLLHREIKDIYLIEHHDCGAYKVLHPDEKVRKAYKEQSEISMESLEEFHRVEAYGLADEITTFCQQQQDTAKAEAAATLKGIKTGKIKPEVGYKKIFELEDHQEIWKGIQVSCFIMDLEGNAKRL
jgi:carbonic anhydrase